ALVLASQQGQSKGIARQRSESGEAQENVETDQAELLTLAAQIRRTRERLQKLTVEGIHQRTHTIQMLTEQMTHTITEAAWQQRARSDGMVQIRMQELQKMDQLLQRMMG